MKTMLPATLAAVATLLASLPADATPRNERGNGNGNGAWTEDGFCPPGLRKRNPPCVPPGQARRGDDDDRDRDDDDREERRDVEPEDVVREIVRRAATNDRSDGDDDDDDEDRDGAQALAIIGGLMGLALLEQAAREREVAPSVPAPAEQEPSYFPFSEVPSRPAWIEALAASPNLIGDAADPAPPVTLGPVAEAVVPEPPVVAPVPALPRIVPLGEPLPGPVPTPQEEAILSDVFRRAADQGTTGY